MKNKKIIYIVVIAVTVVLIVFKLVNNKFKIDTKAKNAIASNIFDVIPVKTTVVKILVNNPNMSESGTFIAVQDLKLTAQTQGKVIQLLAKKTQYVTKGTLLAVIDNSTLTSQLEASQSALEKAVADENRASNALKAGAISQQQYENTQMQVKNARSNLTSLKQQSQNFKIVSPITGVVNDIYIEEGTFVSMGMQLMEIVDITKLNLTVRIDQKNLPKLKFGQKVNVTTDVYPGVILEGKIENVNVKADLSQKIELGITVPNSAKNPLLQGMYGKAVFVTDKNQAIERVLIIPRDAIIGSTQDAKVFVVKADSTVTLRSIMIGRTIENDVEILKGLVINEQVVTSGQINLEEGKKVVVKN